MVKSLLKGPRSPKAAKNVEQQLVVVLLKKNMREEFEFLHVNVQGHSLYIK